MTFTLLQYNLRAVQINHQAIFQSCDQTHYEMLRYICTFIVLAILLNLVTESERKELKSPEGSAGVTAGVRVHHLFGDEIQLWMHRKH